MAILNGPRAGAAQGEAKYLVIFLHGYGADGQDLIGLSQPLAPILPDAAFLSPDAPERCAASPFGRQWFPIPWIDGSPQRAMLDGFDRAEETLNAYLDETFAAEGLDESKTCLVGFSQGTMMALQVGPRREKQLAGIVGFSGRLNAPERLKAEIKTKPPVVLAHGDADEVIPVDSIHDARNGLAEAGIDVRWHVSRGVGHGIDEEGLQLAARFLRDALT